MRDIDLHAIPKNDTSSSSGQKDDYVLPSIIYGNGRSLGSHPGKIEVLREAARREEADILSISESSYFKNGAQGIEGFDIAGNQPKQVSSGAFAAGVTAWIRSDCPIKVLYKNCIEDIDGFQAVELHMNIKITIVVFYRWPNQEEENVYKTGEYFDSLGEDVQLWTFAIIRLLNKPYENEVTLTGQNVPLKCCQLLGLLTQLKRETDL